MIFLNTSETLARLGGAFPPGHRLLGLAGELAAGGGAAPDSGLAERLFSRKGNAAAATAEFGALGASGGKGLPSAAPSAPAAAAAPASSSAAAFLLWFDPCPERAAKSAEGCRQLVLDVPSGRYRVEYWDAAERRLTGVEIATAAPLVLGLPDPRAAYAILIAPLF